ncbi:hypothetical protein FDV58_12265 [Bradyrhizobium elkanii]|uniref:GIY-YIG domain-containing protein n=1 Tax=Bradyrhizobium elkanii TaxID=29448 RepID=A0A4V6CXY3_BRAEL|nr:hypothetical protein [Bradyrhizobium sp. BR2003]TKV81635.1 hypothetical protein FDV58_12265 [Bradyrhizobium elkanii]
MSYWVYILASKPGGTLYVGVTNNLVRRIYEHREGSRRKLYEAIRRQEPRLLRGGRDNRRGASAREKHQALVARVEDRSDRCRQSRLARLI